jgi:hypothetical protein
MLNQKKIMKKGISIHIGLNSIDPSHYNGRDGKLKNPENDANAMHSIATTLNFEATKLLTQQATSINVLNALAKASQELETGDTLFLSYAGHGAQVPDTTNEETDGYDETWVLYDRMLLDDELYNAWSKFKPGVRIIILSDSCHSGTVSRMMGLDEIATSVYKNNNLFRFLSPEDTIATYENNQALYNAVKFGVPREAEDNITACVLLISGCQDNQLSSDGKDNGLFTAKLLQAWGNGTFNGNYKTFHSQITSRMPSIQTPNYSVVGVEDEVFENEKPFSIEASGGRTMTFTTQKSTGKKISWSIEVDETMLSELNEAELAEYICSHACKLMLASLKKFKTLSTQLSSSSGDEISAGCSVKENGWSCHASGTIKR